MYIHIPISVSTENIQHVASHLLQGIESKFLPMPCEHLHVMLLT